MAVHSKPLVNGRPVEESKQKERKDRIPRVAAGLLLLAFGAPLWSSGARFTFDGWVLAINWFLAWIDIPVQIPAIPSSLWYLRILLIVAIGLAYSAVEIHPPAEALSQKRAALVIVLWLLFAIVIGSDIGSTFIGVRHPAPDSWSLTVWIANNVFAASVWSAFLTFVPDWMIIIGWRLLFKR